MEQREDLEFVTTEELICEIVARRGEAIVLMNNQFNPGKLDIAANVISNPNIPKSGPVIALGMLEMAKIEIINKCILKR